MESWSDQSWSHLMWSWTSAGLGPRNPPSRERKPPSPEGELASGVKPPTFEPGGKFYLGCWEKGQEQYMWNCKETQNPTLMLERYCPGPFSLDVMISGKSFGFWTSEPQKEEPAKLSPTGVSVPAGLDREPPVRLKIYIQTFSVYVHTVSTDLYSIEYLT